MEGEMAMIEEFYQRMAALMAQNESNLLARIDELARKTDEQARSNSHRLDRLEERLHFGRGSEDAEAQTSGLEAPQSVAQRTSSPIERTAPQVATTAPEVAERPPRPTITEGLTREVLLEWERRLAQREKELEREKREFQQNSRGVASSLSYPDLGHNSHENHRPYLPNGFPEPVRVPNPISAPVLSERPSRYMRRAPATVTPEGPIPGPTSLETDHPISYIISSRDNVPHFKGEVSACDPLKRNQEIESWIRSIENLVRPPTGEAFIRAARANCRGRAETIINSASFDFIRDWDTFKQELRRKFRGTYSAADFYKVLYDHTMSGTQAPMDFFLQIEASVHQGFRDHREAIGDPNELIRRVFLSGVPDWLRDFLALKDDCTSQQLAETAQRVWNSRNGIRHGHSATQHQSPNSLPDDYRIRRPFTERPYRPRESYSLHPVAVSPQSVPLSGSPPRRPHSNVWCDFHQSATHSSHECRALALSRSPPRSGPYTCYRCGQNGHMARECPFPRRQGDRAPSPTGRFERSQPVTRYPDSRNSEYSGVESAQDGRATSRGTQC